MENRILFGGINSGGWSTPSGAGIDFSTNYPAETSTGRLNFWAYPNTTANPVLTVWNGDVGIGTTSPAVTLHIAGTDAVRIPAGTTAERPTGVTGLLRYNTSTGRLEFYNGSEWTWVAVELPAPAATGGTETTVVDGGTSYRIHTFTASGSLVVASAGYIEVLVVGGGGSGGCHNTTNSNGGGGGGGVIYQKSFAVTPQTYAVTVGNGGAAIAFQVVSRGNNGGNSVFSTLTALGGGGGGSTGVAVSAYDGGSGGGGACCGVMGAGQAIQTGGYGNPGGRSYVGYTGGGGGGAGSAGVNTTIATNSAPDGNGGRGMGFTISGSLVFYAGGGGGGANSSERGGDAYDGGGRGFGATTYYTYLNYPVGTSPTGGSSTPDALANRGGGGGAGSYWSANSTNWKTRGSGAGGSGIVIVRYRQVP